MGDGPGVAVAGQRHVLPGGFRSHVFGRRLVAMYRLVDGMSARPAWCGDAFVRGGRRGEGEAKGKSKKGGGVVQD